MLARRAPLCCLSAQGDARAFGFHTVPLFWGELETRSKKQMRQIATARGSATRSPHHHLVFTRLVDPGPLWALATRDLSSAALLNFFSYFWSTRRAKKTKLAAKLSRPRVFSGHRSLYTSPLKHLRCEKNCGGTFCVNGLCGWCAGLLACLFSRYWEMNYFFQPLFFLSSHTKSGARRMKSRFTRLPPRNIAHNRGA